MNARLEELRNVAVPPMVTEEEKAIRADLATAAAPADEQIVLLIKHLAVAKLGWAAEYVYRTILGSQIAILKYVNTAPGSTREAILPFYERAKDTWPDVFKDFPFDGYLSYVITNALILEHDGRYSITVRGREFLKWIQEAGVTENKAF